MYVCLFILIKQLLSFSCTISKIRVCLQGVIGEPAQFTVFFMFILIFF